MRRLIRALSVRSQLLLMLVLVSVISGLVLVLVGYNSGQRAIEESIFEKLTAIRDAKKYEIEAYFEEASSITEVLGQTPQVAEALDNFLSAYDNLNAGTTRDAACANLRPHYADFVARTAQNLSVVENVDFFFPDRAAGCVLQQRYLLDEPIVDPTTEEYHRVHQQYDYYFTEIVEKFRFYDLFLVELDSGKVVYTVDKEPEFGTGLFSGPYQNSNLAALVRDIKANSDLTNAMLTDFKKHRPSNGVPAAFVGVPVRRGTEVAGALVVQISLDEINRIMTNDGNWVEELYGETGETFLVGDDYLMRSDPRLFLTDTTRFTRAMQSDERTENRLRAMYQLGTTVTTHRAQSPAVEAALAGQDSTRYVTDFRQRDILSSYAPLEVEGLNWIILAEADAREATDPIEDFRHQMLATLGGILLVGFFIAMFLAGSFVRPVERLNQAVQQLKSGDYSQRVPVQSMDEFGQLGQSFNELAEEIETQRETIRQQHEENDTLLQNILPGDVINELKEKGEVVNVYPNVSVIDINLAEYERATEEMPAEVVVRTLNSLLAKMHIVAEKHRVTKIRTVGANYLGVSGMFQARLDANRRTFEFARDLQLMLADFNRNHNLDLHMFYFIHSGEVRAGVLGGMDGNFDFDLWGKTINEINRVHAHIRTSTITVTRPVYDYLKDFYDFRRRGVVGGVALWEYAGPTMGVSDTATSPITANSGPTDS